MKIGYELIIIEAGLWVHEIYYTISVYFCI